MSAHDDDVTTLEIRIPADLLEDTYDAFLPEGAPHTPALLAAAITSQVAQQVVTQRYRRDAQQVAEAFGITVRVKDEGGQV